VFINVCTAVKSSPHIISVDEGLTEESIQQLLTELQSQGKILSECVMCVDT
jgi:hypothetical protein